MLIQRFRKMSPICKGLPQINLVSFTMNEFFTLWGWRSVSSTSGANSSLACVCSSARTSRVVINEAQEALFDYLHYTRGFYYTDAEHISKNSPTFLGYLLSKVEEEQEIKKSIVRYLRYHPINEFEPFFESIGLKPFEFLSFLPPNLMFLSDDNQMLEIFHVLCDYGVPRDIIGNIYKEAEEVFRSDSDLLRSKLMSYENLGLSKSSVIKLITYCPKILISGADKDFFRISEKLRNLGIDYDWVQAYVDGKNTCHWNRILGILDFVGSIGCTDVDLAKLLRIHPKIFFVDSGNQIYAVVALLLKAGLLMSEILDLLVCYPRVLAGEFAKKFWEAIHFLYEVGMGAEEVGKIAKTHTQVLGSYTLLKPESAVLKFKMDRKMIREMIKEDPNELRRFSFVPMSKRALIVNSTSLYLREKTSFLLRMGFVENSEEMMNAIKQCRGRGDQLQERFECLVNAGLEYDAAAAAIRRAPCLLNQSRDLIEKKLDFLINFLGLPIETLIDFPLYLRFDIGRIDRRVKMVNWLKEKGVDRPMALSSLVSKSEKLFIKHNVNLHPDGMKEWKRLNMLSSDPT